MSRAIKVSFGVLLALLLGLRLYAQDPSQHFISAKSGMVNYVEGKPLVFTSDNEAGSKVSARDQLKSGDRLQTQENDRVEVLLNPGSYLRVAANSEIHILQTAFDDTHFRSGKIGRFDVNHNRCFDLKLPRDGLFVEY